MRNRKGTGPTLTGRSPDPQSAAQRRPEHLCPCRPAVVVHRDPRVPLELAHEAGCPNGT